MKESLLHTPYIFSARFIHNGYVFNATGIRAGRPGFYSRQDHWFFSSPSRPDRLWGPPSLIFNGYQGLFPWG